MTAPVVCSRCGAEGGPGGVVLSRVAGEWTCYDSVDCIHRRSQRPQPDRDVCDRCGAFVDSHWIVKGVERPLCPAPVGEE